MKKLKTILRKFLKCLIILLLIILLAIGAGLIWLRSSLSEGTITGLLQDAAAAQGMKLELESLSGPLPERLVLKGVKVYDRQGLFFEANELELKIDIWELFGGKVMVNVVRLSGPTIYRKPELPASPEVSEEPVARDETVGPGLDLNLPVDIILDELLVEKASVPWEMLGLVKAESVAETDTGSPQAALQRAMRQPLIFDLKASASLKQGVAEAGLTLSAAAGNDFAMTLSVDQLAAFLSDTRDNKVKLAAGMNITLGSIKDTLNLGVEAGLSNNDLTLTSLQLKGLGLKTAMDGSFNLGQGNFKGNASIKGNENAAWQKLAAAFGSMDPVLLAAVGSPLNVKADATGKFGDTCRLNLAELRAGVVSGTATAAIPMDFSGPALNIPIDVSAKLAVADLSPFSPDISGAVNTQISASGTLADLKADLSISSPDLQTAAGKMHHLDVRAETALQAKADGSLNASGNLRGKADPDVVGATDLSADWRVNLGAVPPGSKALPPGRAELKNLRIAVFGMDISGELTANIDQTKTASSQAAGPIPPWPAELALDGKIAAGVNDWTPLSTLSGVSMQGGQTALDIELASSADGSSGVSQKAEVKLKLASLAVNLEESVNLKDVNADIMAELGNRGLHDARVNLSAGEGKASTLAWSGFTAAVKGDAGAGDFSVKMLPKATLNKDKKRTDTESIIAANGSYDLNKMEIFLDALSAKDPESELGLALTHKAVIALGQGIKIQGLEVAFTPSGSLKADADIRPGHMEASAQITALPLSRLAAIAGTAIPPSRLDASVDLKNSSRGPQGSLSAELRLLSRDSAPKKNPGSGQQETPPVGGSSVPAPPPDAFIQAELGRSSGRLALTGKGNFAALQSAGDDNTTPAQADAPLTFHIPLILDSGGMPMPDMHAPLKAALKWEGKIENIWKLVPMPDRDAGGLASIDMDVSGSMSSPKAEGTVYLAGGYFEDRVLGLQLNDIALEAKASTLHGARVVAALTDGKGGACAVEGDVSLKGEPSLDFKGQIRHLSPLHRDDLAVTLSGIFSAKGPLAGPAIDASILVERGEVNLVSTLGGGSITTLEISDRNAVSEPIATTAGPVCNITVDIPQRFYIRGRGMDSEWKGKLNVSGALSEPSITGSLGPVRGYFELLSKPFQFTGGEIAFTGGSNINPALNLELTYEGPDLKAIIAAGGSLEKPKLDLKSVPPLPQDEVLAHVLFGKRMSELSRFETLQLANGMRELAGIGDSGLNPLTAMRETVGLDVLRVGGGGGGQDTRQDSGMSGASNLAPVQHSDSTQETSPTLEAGKYINDSIYVGVEQGMTQESTGVRVEIELFPNVTLQGKTTTESSQAGIGWKMDY